MLIELRNISFFAKSIEVLGLMEFRKLGKAL